jgi:hypothetical protein
MSTLNKILLVALGVLLVATVVMFVIMNNKLLNEKIANRENLSRIAELHGSIEIMEGVQFNTGLKINGLTDSLVQLLDENSKLSELVDRRIEDVTTATTTTVVVRETEFVSRPEERQEEDIVNVTVTERDDYDESGANVIVEFDLVRNNFRLLGSTESRGPSINITMSQVEPFRLNTIITRQRRSGDMNIFVEDQSGMLDLTVDSFYFDDQYDNIRWYERLGIGGGFGITGSGILTNVHLSLDMKDNMTIFAGPSFDGGWGGNFGVTFRPFRRQR